MKKLTKKEEREALDLIVTVVENLKHRDDVNIYEQIGGVKYWVNMLRDLIKNGYDDYGGHWTFEDCVAVVKKELSQTA